MTLPTPNVLNTVATGGVSSKVFITLFETRAPTTTDLNYSPSQRWVDTTTNKEYCLFGFTSTGGVVAADWRWLGAGQGDILFLAGNSGGNVGPDVSNVVNVVGDNTTITIVGNPATNTLTASLIGGLAAIEEFIPDSGTSPVVPNGSGQVTMAGSGSTTTVGGLNSLTFELTGLTNHNVLVGAGTTTITKVPPSATSGVPLISQGAAADPAFGTAVVAGGGTGDTSFTAYAVICGGTTSTNPLQSVSGVGTTGQVLTSNGANMLPTWQAGSVATSLVFAYLSAATTNDKTGDATDYTIIFDTAPLNVGTAYNVATGLFTAPATGVYMFQTSILAQNIGAAHTLGSIQIQFTTPSMASLQSGINSPAAVRSNGDFTSFLVSGIASMVANQTAQVVLNIGGSTKTIGVGGNASQYYTYFCVTRIS